LRSAGLDNVKVVIGGAPITKSFADEIGADGFAPDAASAVEVVRKLVAV
jgi:5-methyltetrahydrofolate--homocysteine methyltransferase